MPLQNRVAPSGQIVENPARGLFMGNRGILHDAARNLGPKRWRHKNWIICTLTLRPGWRKRTLMAPGRYTELFFLDEAVALAAGHRPCAECRRSDYRAFCTAWPHPFTGAVNLDKRLHEERAIARTNRLQTWESATAKLPAGAFVQANGQAFVIVAEHLMRPFDFTGYGPPVPVPNRCTVLTPPSTVAALANGYRAHLHPSAGVRGHNR